MVEKSHKAVDYTADDRPGLHKYIINLNTRESTYNNYYVPTYDNGSAGRQMILPY